jgi:hypothetical protein
MNWKGFGRNGSWPNTGSFLEELREIPKASFMTAGVPAYRFERSPSRIKFYCITDTPTSSFYEYRG